MEVVFPHLLMSFIIPSGKYLLVKYKSNRHQMQINEHGIKQIGDRQEVRLD